MIKKIIATGLCLALTTPCFAAGRFDDRPQNPPRNMPRNEFRYDHPDDFGGERDFPNERHSSAATKTFAVVAGVVGVAAIISALAD